MPAMANITVTNRASANVVYVAATPSAGDKNAAVWTQTAASAIIGNRPKFTAVSRDNGNKNARTHTFTLRFPIVETIDSRPVVTAVVPMTLTIVAPTNVDGTSVEDAFIQGGNILVNSLIRSIVAEGFSPT